MIPDARLGERAVTRRPAVAYFESVLKPAAKATTDRFPWSLAAVVVWPRRGLGCAATDVFPANQLLGGPGEETRFPHGWALLSQPWGVAAVYVAQSRARAEAFGSGSR